MVKDIQKWWEADSAEYQAISKIGTESAHYGPWAPNENKLRLLGKVNGKKILEIGCGGGQCSIAFAKQGAICTGVDFSSAQLKHAQDLARKNKVSVKFIKHNIQNLHGFNSKYDVVFSAFALQYVPNLSKGFEEVARVLKKGGVFVFSFGHPFYDSISKESQALKRNYNSSERIEQIASTGGKEHKFIMHVHKISDICNSLVQAGLTIEKVLEPLDLTSEKAWRGGVWDKYYPKKLVKKLVPTIIFKARKN